MRQEYDYVPLSGKLNPELYLKLISHTIDIGYKYKSGEKFSGTFGFNGITQGNVRKYEMLIPNFRNYSGGLYDIERWTNGRLTFEGGARYDYSWMKAYLLDNNTAKVVTPVFRFQNLTGSIGSQYYLNPQLSWEINLGTAWRAPGVNELFSNGIHQSAFAYELGNPNLHLEREYSANTSLHLEGRRLQAEIGLYDNLIDGYIFLKPDLQIIHTVRGSYPTFTYTQVNADFKGIDLSGTVDLLDSLSFTTKITYLHVWNKTIHNYLQQIPPNRIENSLRYGFSYNGFLKQPDLAVTVVSIGRQSNVPPKSDYLAPPGAYTLINVSAGGTLTIGRQVMNISLSCDNLLNVAYRDYMDRFRYFADEMGRNITMRINMPLGKSN